MTIVSDTTPLSQFRGARTYVHSTDMYDTTAALVQAAGLSFEGPIDLRIRARIDEQLRYVLATGELEADLGPAVTCRFTSRGLGCVMAMIPTGEKVTSSKPYDEDAAGRLANVDGRTARLTSETGLRPIEAVTALAVHLHKTALPPPAGKRWMLSQLTLGRALRDTESADLTLVIDKVVGSSMSRTRLEGQHGLTGSMMFILG